MNMKRLFILLAALTAVLSCGEEAEELNKEVQLLCVTVDASDAGALKASVAIDDQSFTTKEGIKENDICLTDFQRNNH